MSVETNKILVCGDRNWTNRASIENELRPSYVGQHLIIIHGACRGADQLAGEVASAFGYDVIAVPAEWVKYGRSAGIKRNIMMFNTHQPDMVLAFHANIEQSKGTKHMIAYAKKHGCPVRLVTK